jgi:hypothetical protein
MNFKSKNLILLIGNGFDLAHKLKTSYNDFSNFIIDRLSHEALFYSLSNISATFFDENFHSEIKKNMHGFSNKFIYEITLHVLNRDSSSISNYLRENTNELKPFLKNKFLGKLYTNQYENWFDIENAYFKELIEIKNNSNEDKTSKIIELNKNLEEIKKLLFEYLKTIEVDINREVKTFFNSMKIGSLENIYVLNFNYTITLENYLENSNKIIINYIHGDIKSDDIIFGFGNDQHIEYQKIKESGVDEYLRFFKTFEYMKNKNYSDVYDYALERFNDYDVCVIGHSLSQTDKTLLKEILNNPKCKRIHLYKRTDLKNDSTIVKEAFSKQIFSLSRIIDNEKDLRVKVLNFEDSYFFP